MVFAFPIRSPRRPKGLRSPSVPHPLGGLGGRNGSPRTDDRKEPSLVFSRRRILIDVELISGSKMGSKKERTAMILGSKIGPRVL